MSCSASEIDSDHSDTHGNEIVDSEPEQDNIASYLQDGSRKRVRTYDEKDDDVCVPTKKATQHPPATGGAGRQLSMIHFMKTKQLGEKQVKDMPPLPKRDYTKYRQVCLIWTKNVKLKDKSLSILSRGGSHQIKRHHERNHPSLSLSTVKLQVVPLDHISVPKDIRALVSKQSISDKQANKTVNSVSSINSMMILDNDELSPSTSAQTKDPKEIRSANHASSTNETLTGM